MVESMSSPTRIAIGILGASGYTGAELVRLLARHPDVEIKAVTADKQAGKPLAEVFPHLAGLELPKLTKIDDVDWANSGLDVVFCALPHGTTQEVVGKIVAASAKSARRLRVIDLSADFRLSDTATYAEWYGHEHRAPELQREAVYGLTEFMRDRIREARIVACPGCYPTTSLLPLVPLLRARQIDPDDIIIDAKSGVSGAGREAKQGSLYAEVGEGIHAYGVASHRHGPEIEQELSRAAGRKIVVNFTPHLMPMNRGILASIYVRLANGVTADDLRATLARAYADEPFVSVVPVGVSPATRHVRGSNHCLIGVFPDRVKGRAIVLSTLDNLVKGASGQAVQNMNLMCQLPEARSLEQLPLFP
jgi:N-acetyl-gamma-glutamyl-phosphate reductase